MARYTLTKDFRHGNLHLGRGLSIEGTPPPPPPPPPPFPPTPPPPPPPPPAVQYIYGGMPYYIPLSFLQDDVLTRATNTAANTTKPASTAKKPFTWQTALLIIGVGALVVIALKLTKVI